MSFHPIRGEQDADALYAVQTGRMAHDKIDPFCASEGFPTRDDLHAELVQVVAENRQDQWLVAQMDVIRLRTVAEFRTRARDLYGSVGFHVLKEFPRYRKPFNVPKPETISARPIVYAME